ncbi:EAL domain, c-di-GMP-specific phosphodiesterase class I (or its enzymatically inactive variant) [Paraburkholderia lycopersici]|uniref:EAL domain, c-di-GMP-specific phosphodiesterase class I (Or its enzymatically inactive variant) n=1 Tax=Paraburkholderia lycopersici TaxID=416944 RepID=A0A1G6H805_9BURK|nr:EAL domain, c-di-GMP-specific phosphodiesterase class I (or its enzymatically inactive variant) [Paraburkholderia lycopersici]
MQIGEFVLEEACRQAHAWARQYPDIVVSVNVSPVQFVRSDLTATVAATLARTGVSPRNIELEITEGVLMAPRSLATLRALREMGLSIAIDDFGSGYSSLAYIRSFMADRLKLDMSFVNGIGHSRADEVIVKAVLALGQTPGMRVVAEGVETLRQLEFLIENGCNEAQGYWFARPVDVAAAQAYLEASHAPGVPQSQVAPEADEPRLRQRPRRRDSQRAACAAIRSPHRSTIPSTRTSAERIASIRNLARDARCYQTISSKCIHRNYPKPTQNPPLLNFLKSQFPLLLWIGS